MWLTWLRAQGLKAAWQTATTRQGLVSGARLCRQGGDEVRQTGTQRETLWRQAKTQGKHQDNTKARQGL